MCLLLVAYNTHPDYSLIVAANRDEFHERPAAAAAAWDDESGIFGGRDLEANGTWLAVNQFGAFAALTNVRGNHQPGRHSRGQIAVDFLSGGRTIAEFIDDLSAETSDYGGYNFIGYDGTTLGWYNNIERRGQLLKSGVYGLSNASLDTPWPKVERIKQHYFNTAHGSAFTSGEVLVDALFATLEDRNPAADLDLPDSGVGIETERRLAPIFVEGNLYGTRCSTVVTVKENGELFFAERRFAPNRTIIGETRKLFDIKLRDS